VKKVNLKNFFAHPAAHLGESVPYAIPKERNANGQAAGMRSLCIFPLKAR